MTGVSSVEKPHIPIKAANLTFNPSTTTFNKQKLLQNCQQNRQQQYYRNLQPHVIKPLRSNQSLILPGMGIIGRSIKFEVRNDQMLK